jgi:hypothetical protein
VAPTPLWAGVATTTLGQKTMLREFSSVEVSESDVSL